MVEVYQFRVFLREISPAIWRRLLIRSDHTIADLHYTLQITLGWTDSHLNRFIIRGKQYGVAHIGGMSFTDDPREVRLSDFHFRPLERFLYEYDFGDRWQHEIRLEDTIPLDSSKTYPLCTGGARKAPPEDCGGPDSFQVLKQHFNEIYLLRRLLQMCDEGGTVGDYWEELQEFKYWWYVDKFDRRAANRRLKLYSAGYNEWRWM